MQKYLLILFVLSIFIGCSNNEIKQSISKEIKALNNFDKQSAYLENIYQLDQGVRRKLNEVEKAYSFDSPQVKEVYEEMRQIDELNLLKIEKYLEVKGHPAKEIHSEEALNTPFIVYHHNMDEDVRLRGFKHLYEAYLKGNIDEDTLAFYLNRSYYDKSKGQRITWNRPYRVEEELDTLYQVLDLLPVIEKIKNSK